ncbi:ribosomal RNA processing protein 1 homolog B [Esox lucius]|uniref:Ribosomal RNA processing 1B n=1 Tax=Esox lucius TaxID=8010 RepID=A0AAY5L7W9_ESOLU|nr:ribosomal RNA processing protein 1 homolog B [Esox lucius]
MAPTQAPEIQFAQRLASNEKPMRTKAIKKLKKYITVRSQAIDGGFSSDELLKLWKGLFYCLWMQDKLLLQEELSNQISGLIHCFQNVQTQFLFLETFLQTMKREWTGIDRLRMDKFFQLVRFVFRKTLEMMKSKEWETSLVTRFLDVLSSQVLHSTSGAPAGLQFHIMDLYMSELAAVGSAELTAAQNLTFIDPFCKIASKTKDRILLKAICSSIFSVIVDQAPFAIEDLMKEVKASGVGVDDSDSGQASEEEEEEKVKTLKGKKPAKKTTLKQSSGTLSTDYDENLDEEEDEMLHLESDSESEMLDDKEVGPVLQFDYSALADRLFGLASRSNTSSHNRQRLYKVIKIFRDLSEGVFPQDEYPEEVSTDEDDDEMFGSRKRMKRGRGFGEEEEAEGSTPAKKQRGKKAAKPGKSDQSVAPDESKAAEAPSDTTTKKKKRRKKKKKTTTVGEVKSEEQNGVLKAEVDTTPATAPQTTTCSEEATGARTEPSTLKCSPEVGKATVKTETGKGTDAGEKMKRKAVLDSKASPVGGTAIKMDAQSERQQDVVVGSGSSVTVMEIGSSGLSETPVSDTKSTKKKKTNKAKTSKQQVEVVETETVTQDSEAVDGATGQESAPETTRKTRKRRRKSANKESVQKTTVEEVQMVPVAVEKVPPLKTKMKAKQTAGSTEKNAAQTDVTPSAVPELKISQAKVPPSEISLAAATPLKKKKQKVASEEKESVEIKGEAQPGTKADVITVSSPADVATPTPLKKKKTAKAEKQSVAVGGRTQMEADLSLLETDLQPMEVATPTPLKKKKKAAVQVFKEQDSEVVTEADLDTPAKTGKKKRKIPVVIEVEADELEAEAARVNGLAEVKKVKLTDESKEPSTPVSAKKPKKMTPKKAKLAAGSDFVTFQNHATIPTPLFFRTTKGSPSTPLSSKKKKKCQTPNSESKKVTFGLSKNKTAEFRKTDRSLLVSPEGSSRVPFDPKQKPLFGVLKSPAASLNSTKKMKSTPKVTPKRPTAADFF